MRKVIGATRGNLMRQFLGESVLLTSLAFITGILLAYVLTPTYNQLLNKELNPLQLVNLASVGILFGLKHLKRPDQSRSGRFWLDNIIYIPARCRDIRIGEFFTVIICQFLRFGFRIFRFFQIFAEDNLYRAFGTHHRDLSGWPGVVHITPNMLGIHNIVRTAICFTGNNG